MFHFKAMRLVGRKPDAMSKAVVVPRRVTFLPTHGPYGFGHVLRPYKIAYSVPRKVGGYNKGFVLFTPNQP